MPEIEAAQSGEIDRQGVACPTIAVCMPAYNAEHLLSRSLGAIGKSTRLPDEIIIFDDASTDRTAVVAVELGARVIKGEANAGPGAGRNLLATETDADFLLFVDADVVIDPGAIERLEAVLVSRPDVAATFGAYNDRPHHSGAASMYANLRHHFIHRQNAGECRTFWSGLGMIRRDVFCHFGGYDSHRFAGPSIEDVDLGARMTAQGQKIILEPRAQGAHLKKWTLKGLWRSDIFDRALPWARLIRADMMPVGQLNGGGMEQLRALLAYGILGAFALTLISAVPFWSVGLVGAAYVLANAPFFMLLLDRSGIRRTLIGMFLHWVYHLYASAIIGSALIARLSSKIWQSIFSSKQKSRSSL
ncbi:glycosyltransferase family 2 protein [Parvularcula sp. LCG005]|uniref:glycosyltransferase family 2 protein n=1 Tax=Parvularcula sp. LCG005 TaxID=3078805 RepID=UPI0029430195|nr:glycosyltransferase family 2 protein [Parvularcula sp. LCG005]WOI54048.1 glycosyltransferase family 2 protein [Parvularcula sp. LCG005]